MTSQGPRYTARDLMQVSGLSAKTIRRYVKDGVLPRSEGDGRGTRYGREHYVRLAAARASTSHPFAMKDALWGMRGTPLAALEKSLAAKEAPSAPALRGGARLQRVVLLPGLELLVREDAGEVILRTAAEIQAKYGARA